MSDTFLATKTATKNQSLLVFGKNSNREPNEAQEIVHLPKRKNKEKVLQTSYIEISQVKESYEVILSKPITSWGAEMGANEHGLVVGYVPVFTKAAMSKNNMGLTGLDLVRVALERCKTSAQALDVITSLVEEFGQDANSGFSGMESFHHNSFLLGDANESYILETVDRHWVAKKINGFQAISNILSITNDFQFSSKGLMDYAKKLGFHKSDSDFSFAETFNDWFRTKMNKGKHRLQLVTKMGEMFSLTEGVGVKESMDILRSHNVANYSPENGNNGSICQHASGMLTPYQTTGSMVFEIKNNKKLTVWLTGTSAPCLSLYKPFYFGNDILDENNQIKPSKVSDDSLWWKSEKFHRLALNDYKYAHNLVFKERQESERHWRRKDRELQSTKTSTKQLREFSDFAINHHKEILRIWTRDLLSRKRSSIFNPLFNMFWNARNKEAELEL
ncbi:C69 family dipeptidase [Leptospira sp. GIMC2001]|uniref:C69 family dipeptidase n=1 Tax=Leptospira sp. GIMC2001 TaxID=1513297 RepID=UPI00234A4C40|nr:C69 family dipeptidase [Leptospira sp. GIMC2001]WCL48452.1 C69 family dipeptidase [Leptospira sp. GIMC2001]